MKKCVFLFICVVAVAFGANGSPSNNYILNDFTVRALSSSMVFDPTKPFSIGLGYKQFASENYVLAGARFSNVKILDTKGGGYVSVIVPIKYLCEENFTDRWWEKIWLDAWVYLSF